jgi:hypothetical protein
MPKSAPLAVTTRRLLAHYSESTVELPEHQAFLIGRLFEEGDTPDLRWLTENFSEEELLVWLQTHGGRSLSQRSLAFWATLLRDPQAIANRLAANEGLWPL